MTQEQVQMHRHFNSHSEYYAPCFTCEKHPFYPQAPITLHKGGVCLICKNVPNTKKEPELPKP
ncbi:MAG TPA: hypothetical protein VED17_11465 [Nitrososphaerales archaeon]|nr:hypothetical protein [Nitrososphaerales archaeon]